MRPERERVIAHELSQWQKRTSARGVQVSQEQKRAEEVQLAKVHKTFPFVWVLAFAVALAVLAGILRTKPPTAEPRIGNRLLAIAALIAFASTWAVIVIDGLVM